MPTTIFCAPTQRFPLKQTKVIAHIYVEFHLEKIWMVELLVGLKIKFQDAYDAYKHSCPNNGHTLIEDLIIFSYPRR